jgi:hypothetical protein
MRGLKLAAIAIGAVIALIFVFSVIHLVIDALIFVAIAALVAGGVYAAFKLGRASNREVSKGSRESEVQDARSARPLPRADVEPYTPPAQPTVSRPVTGANVDDELARLKREMGN